MGISMSLLADSAASFVLPAPAHFNFLATVHSHGWLQLPPFTWLPESERLEYVFESPSGVVARMWLMLEGRSLRVMQPDARRAGDLQEEITDMARRMLELDRDLRPFYQFMRAQDGYDWLEERGRGRILTCPDAWENLAKILLTTNCNWAQTVQMCRRLCQLGAPHPTVPGLQAFPSPKRIAAMSFDELAESVRAGYRNAYLHELAEKIASGAVDPESWHKLDSDELFRAVKSLKGFGDYAAATYTRLAGRYDRLAIDSTARAMFAARYKDGVKGSDQDIRDHYARFGDWRGLVLWQEIMRHHYDA